MEDSVPNVSAYPEIATPKQLRICDRVLELGGRDFRVSRDVYDVMLSPHLLIYGELRFLRLDENLPPNSIVAVVWKPIADVVDVHIYDHMGVDIGLGHSTTAVVYIGDHSGEG